MNLKRVRIVQNAVEGEGSVVYWMSRDQRVQDNWALIFSQQLAKEKKKSLVVIFNLVSDFLGGTIRQYGFMLKGLQEVESELEKYGVPFVLLQGKPATEIPGFIMKNNVSVLVTDFDPLRIKRTWKKEVAEKIKIPFYEVDAHNIVPCLYVSDKAEFAAYTIRPKIHKLLPEFLDEFQLIQKMKQSHTLPINRVDWEAVKESLKVDGGVKEVDWINPGERAAIRSLENFLEKRFTKYSEERNDPNKNALSNLSPYLHFGQISAQRIALTVQQFYQKNISADAFLEELIIRRELSDNFCYFNPKYNSFDGFHDWAKETLNKHRKDKRDYIYSLEEFENADTQEDL
jgi:deoxyribodipyrimidine photo-lyase